jgi:hypothetical protein
MGRRGWGAPGRGLRRTSNKERRSGRARRCTQTWHVRPVCAPSLAAFRLVKGVCAPWRMPMLGVCTTHVSRRRRCGGSHPFRSRWYRSAKTILFLPGRPRDTVPCRRALRGCPAPGLPLPKESSAGNLILPMYLAWPSVLSATCSARSARITKALSPEMRTLLDSFEAQYGHRDPRGGSRSSNKEPDRR